MPLTVSASRSLRTRITLGILAIFLLSMWSLSFFSSHVLQQDMERLLGEQQFSTVTLVAGEVDRELADRVKVLEAVASVSWRAMQNGPADMQALLNQSSVLPTLFNGGVIAYAADGTEVADFPESAQRSTASYMDIDVVRAALKEGRASVGRPVHNQHLENPIFGVAAPIRDAQGRVIGALAGVINLGMPNFLDGLTASRYGKNGYFQLIEPIARFIITDTDKRHVLQFLPAIGVMPLMDRQVSGHEVTGITRNFVGQEVLASAQRVPVANWIMVAASPTDEIFAPVHAMQQRMALITLGLTLLAGMLSWWLLRSQLSPLLRAAQTLSDMGERVGPLQPLPITNNDEIGQMIGGFNRLLTDLGQREAVLNQILDTSSVAIFLVDRDGRITQANQRMAEMFGRTVGQLLGSEYVSLVHPKEREVSRKNMLALLNSDIPSVSLDRSYWRSNQSEFWGHLTGGRFHDALGNDLGLIGVIADISERKRAEDSLRASEQRFRDLVNTTDGIVWEARADNFTFSFVSAQAERLLGFPCSDWLKPGFWVAHLHPEDQAWAPAFCGFHTARIESHNFEYRFIAHDGRTVWLRDMVTVVSEDGQPRWLRGLMVDVTKRRETDEKLRANEARYRAVTHSSNDAIITADSAGSIAHWNRGAQAIFGYTEAQAIGLPLTELIPHQFRERHNAGFARWLAGDTTQMLEKTVLLEGLRQSGTLFPMELSLAAWETGEGRFITAIIRDVSERKRAEASLRIAATAFESQEAMTITDANRIILKVNKAFTRITGYTEQEAVGQTPALLKSGLQDRAFYQTMWQNIERDQYWQGEIWNRRKNGNIYPERLSISAVLDELGQVSNYVGAFSDISQHKQAQKEIELLAFTDPLTELPNRRLLMDRLKHAIASSDRSKHEGALLFIDLDNFKTLNDTLGHDIGDLLLQQVTKRLVDCVRDCDTVARLGGDEFVVLLENLDQEPIEAARQARIVGDKILLALNMVYTLAGYVHHNSASIGVTLFGQISEPVDEVLKRADLAMYSAKTAGRNALRFFDPKMQTVVTTRAALDADMREAVEKNQFLLYYQVQVTSDGRATGAEVLIRWLHPHRGMVSPAEFIPAAEDTGLILPIGHWVLETACKQLAIWATQPESAHLTLAVNVSPRQFYHRDFVDQVLAVLQSTGANPKRLKLELTEGMLVANVSDVIDKMNALKARGVAFSLDDFGTGYSSLAYLKRMPLDQLKIDQGFVRDILIDPNDAAIAKMVVALAQSLGLAVIAEGVETDPQREFLAVHGCHAYQGYLYSRPLPLADFEKLMMQYQYDAATA